jgi:hypothetical protein
MSKEHLMKAMSLLSSDSDGEVLDDVDLAYNLVLKTIRTRFNMSAQEVFAEVGSTKDHTREQLAAYAHSTWSGWMKYQLSKATVNEDGTWTIPAQSVERWTRQMNTDFHNLPDSEKKSDFDEADKILSSVSQG